MLGPRVIHHRGGYSHRCRRKPKYADPQEATNFAADPAIDAMAESAGNVHLQKRPKGQISVSATHAIEAVTDVPLVDHSSSGVPTNTERQLAGDTNVCKSNVDTELRTRFSTVLRDILTIDIDCFDRAGILSHTQQLLCDTPRNMIRSMSFSESFPRGD